jgi:multiple sugar transport system substrate-binding protein
MDTVLKGLTWDHPRGYAPLVAGAAEYVSAHPGLEIHWGRRSLRDFGEAPIERLIGDYDLLIVDHPFVGFASAHEVLTNLGPFVSQAERERLAADSVGPSWESYWYDGGLWALPIDAATQVASYRPDLLRDFAATIPATFDEVLDLGRRTRSAGKSIIVPACATDAVSMVFSLSASFGHPIAEDADPFLPDEVGRKVLDRLHALISIAHPRSVDWNPIQVYDHMVADSDTVYCPYGFGYTNYSRKETVVPLKFVDAPAATQDRPAATMLGGAGVAVSYGSAHPEEAIAYAKWLASPEHQRGTYFRAGGQPASLAAWQDPVTDAAAGGFFSGTLKTLQSAYLRPRFNGFVKFFEAAGAEINKCLRGQVSDSKLVALVNERYAKQREVETGRIS